MKLYKINKANIFCMIFLILLLGYFLLVFHNAIPVSSDWKKLYIPMLLTTIMSFITIKTNKKMVSLNANTVILIYMVISLLSLLLLLPIFPEIENIRSQYSMSFLYYPELVPSICIGCVGIISFTLFSSLISNFNKEDVDKKLSMFGSGINDMEENKNSLYEKISTFSLILLVFTLLYYVYFSITNIGFFSSTYGSRLSTTNSDRLYTYSVVIMALSFVMFITTTNRKKMKYGLIVFAMISMIQFLLGNRGEVFYPTLAAIAIYRKRGGTFKRRHLYIGTIGVLIIIPLIRIVRNIGALSFNYKTLIGSFNIFSVIAESFGEMGFQIGTVTYMLRYLNTGGLLQHGATYIYSFHYFLYNKIPFLPAIDLNSPAAIKTIMPVNFFAFTNVGEAYFNFGMIGVILFSFILAFYLCKTSKASKKLGFELFHNMMLVEMLAWVRNSSGTLPVYIAWTIVLIVLAFIFSSLVKTKRRSGDD